MSYVIMRFMRHKNQSIKNIQDHNERRKDEYKSNDKIDPARTPQNFHIVEPTAPYRAEIKERIDRAGCRVRKDSVKYIETLITASHGFFECKTPAQVREFFAYATEFMKQEVGGGNIFSAVVHMDEETPHMHLCFTPITQDGRLCAKEIIGNRQKLVKWQDKLFEHLSARYPDLERGISAAVTKRKHIPVQLFKQSVYLGAQMEEIRKEMAGVNAVTAGRKRDTVLKKLEEWFPAVEAFETKVQQLQREVDAAGSANGQLAEQFGQADDKHFDMLMRVKALEHENERYKRFVAKLPHEIKEQMQQTGKMRPERFSL